MDTDMCISEAMQCVCNNAYDIITTLLPTNALEREFMSHSMTSGYGCKKARGTQCYQQFSQEYVTSVRQSCANSLWARHGHTWANCSMCKHKCKVSTIKAHHKEADRKRGYSSFTHHGKPVCHKMFRFLHGIGVKRFKNLAKTSGRYLTTLSLFVHPIPCYVCLQLHQAACFTSTRKSSQIQLFWPSTPVIECVLVSHLESVPRSGRS